MLFESDPLLPIILLHPLVHPDAGSKIIFPWWSSATENSEVAKFAMFVFAAEIAVPLTFELPLLIIVFPVCPFLIICEFWVVGVGDVGVSAAGWLPEAVFCPLGDVVSAAGVGVFVAAGVSVGVAVACEGDGMGVNCESLAGAIVGAVMVGGGGAVGTGALVGADGALGASGAGGGLSCPQARDGEIKLKLSIAARTAVLINFFIIVFK